MKILAVSFTIILFNGFSLSLFGKTPQNLNFNQTEKLLQYEPYLAFNVLNKLLHQSLQNKDEKTTAQCYSQIGLIFYNQGAFTQALDCYNKAGKIFKNFNELFYAENLNKIGQTYYYNSKRATALSNYNKALQIFKKLNYKKGLAETYGLIGQIYEKEKKLDSALYFQNIAFNGYLKLNDLKGLAKINENLGSIYEDKSEFKIALNYYQKALAINQKEKNKIAQIEILNNLGDMYRKTNQLDTALKYSFKAKNWALNYKDFYELSSAYRDIAKTYNLMGRADSAYFYSLEEKKIYAQIFTESSNRQMALLETIFSFQEKNQEILKLENEKKINKIVIYGTLVVIMLIVFIGFNTINKQKISIANKSKLVESKRVLHETKKRALEVELSNKLIKEDSLKLELELKSKELTTHTLHIIQKNQLLEDLKSKLNLILKDDKRDQKKEIKMVLGLINQNNNQDNNWEDFRIIFEQVHEKFFTELKKRANNLTPSDFRLLALLKMNLNSADIATMLGISQDSLRTSRYRLRQKLQLAEGENLLQFIQQL
ncbi:tetratricopeptide repeat protein [Pedobacter cryophilus]|uniref:Tetratricopeptide repeat protein n=1 Tax=Pedobacter cryophilus TaxID=2571271 RepID=A0A4U1BXD6_9SPHI|nr:tetratricopeptide repeat protein [Pedobacter cryophilus]TKB97676.1 tetratricopeptide repeat protein [Pedobacter cryophilus]